MLTASSILEGSVSSRNTVVLMLKALRPSELAWCRRPCWRDLSRRTSCTACGSEAPSPLNVFTGADQDDQQLREDWLAEFIVLLEAELHEPCHAAFIDGWPLSVTGNVVAVVRAATRCSRHAVGDEVAGQAMWSRRVHEAQCARVVGTMPCRRAVQEALLSRLVHMVEKVKAHAPCASLAFNNTLQSCCSHVLVPPLCSMLTLPILHTSRLHITPPADRDLTASVVKKCAIQCSSSVVLVSF